MSNKKFYETGELLDAGAREKFPMKNCTDGWSGHEKTFVVKSVVRAGKNFSINS